MLQLVQTVVARLAEVMKLVAEALPENGCRDSRDRIAIPVRVDDRRR